jgi:hypothetical protein
MIKCFRTLSFLFCFSIFYHAYSQKLEFISSSNTSDSSFYDICKLTENEFWIGGEHGILKTIDSSANINSIIYNNQGNGIYKMLKAGNYLYIAADNGTLYKFNLNNRKLEKVFTSNKYKNRCFYDLILLKNGKLLVCGGKSEILKAKLTLPLGFVLEVDTSFNGKTQILWKSKFNFVWSLAQNDEKIYASVFNGKYSKILIAEKPREKFKKKYKIKALVHKIILQQDTLWLLGSENIHFRDDGIIGKLYNDSVNITTISGKGCVWSMLFLDDLKLAFTNNGTILYKKSGNWIPYNLNPQRTIYATKQISKNSILMVGNGKTVVLLKK